MHFESEENTMVNIANYRYYEISKRDYSYPWRRAILHLLFAKI